MDQYQYPLQETSLRKLKTSELKTKPWRELTEVVTHSYTPGKGWERIQTLPSLLVLSGSRSPGYDVGLSHMIRRKSSSSEDRPEGKSSGWRARVQKGVLCTLQQGTTLRVTPCVVLSWSWWRFKGGKFRSKCRGQLSSGPRDGRWPGAWIGIAQKSQVVDSVGWGRCWHQPGSGQLPNKVETVRAVT